MAGRQRRLIWLAGHRADGEAAAASLISSVAPERLAWIGGGRPGHLNSIRCGNGRSLLGKTLDAGVLNAHTGLDPDDLGILAGTIRGGGALVLITPAPDDWIRLADAACQRWLSHGRQPAEVGDAFITRLIGWLETTPWIERPRPESACALAPPMIESDPATLTLTPEQQQAVEAMIALTHHPDPGVLLLTADRGRGKSTALGLAMDRQGGRARLTGPSRSAVQTAIAHSGSRPPTFIAPEDVRPDEAVLFIDEAAALPLARVQQLLRDNPRCVLTGTVHGYEGSGHGLTLRLHYWLAGLKRKRVHRHLAQPVRWPQDDRLEALIHRILLLDAEPAPLQGTAAETPTTGQADVEAVDPRALATDETALAQAFGLLVGAHYRTRPRDLRQMLDDPDSRVWRIREQGQTTAVAIVRQEGGLGYRLGEAIHQGQRRPRGHLIAQSLAFHAGIPRAPTCRGLRIQRLAVHPQRQRQGLGSDLVAAIARSAATQGLDWIGASFGSAEALLAFWWSNGFRPVRLGNQADPRSGQPSVIVLKPLSGRGEALCRSARARLAVHLPGQIEAATPALDPAIVSALQRDLPSPHPSVIDARDLRAFAYGHRLLLDSRGAIARYLACPQRTGNLSARERRVLDAAVASPQDARALRAATDTAGRREAIGELRRLTMKLLENAHD
jgi:tRNA(Met) cytidine acetyltransferase